MKTENHEKSANRPEEKTSGGSEYSIKSRMFKIVMNLLLPLVLLSVGWAAAAHIRQSGPEPRKRPVIKSETIVNTMVANAQDSQVIIRANGEVVPARTIALKARVAGEVGYVHDEFTAGGVVKKGETILKVDDEDYRLSVVEKKGVVSQKKYALELEKGQQVVAKREWELLRGTQAGGSAASSLALRVPHLEMAEAELAAANADLRQARLDLARTKIQAPFNAIVLETHVDAGSIITSQETLAELVSTDRFRIQVSVPVDRLKWISVPGRDGTGGSKVIVSWGTDRAQAQQRMGKVVRLLGDLDENGRMARLLVSVTDPLNLSGTVDDRQPLLLGSYVRVEIEGHSLENVIRIPRTALREEDRIWVASDKDTLTIFKAQVIWRDEDYILISEGALSGARLVVSDIAVPVEGMSLKVSGLQERARKTSDSG